MRLPEVAFIGRLSEAESDENERALLENNKTRSRVYERLGKYCCAGEDSDDKELAERMKAVHRQVRYSMQANLGT